MAKAGKPIKRVGGSRGSTPTSSVSSSSSRSGVTSSFASTSAASSFASSSVSAGGSLDGRLVQPPGSASSSLDSRRPPTFSEGGASASAPQPGAQVLTFMQQMAQQRAEAKARDKLQSDRRRREIRAAVMLQCAARRFLALRRLRRLKQEVTPVDQGEVLEMLKERWHANHQAAHRAGFVAEMAERARTAERAARAAARQKARQLEQQLQEQQEREQRLQQQQFASLLRGPALASSAALHGGRADARPSRRTSPRAAGRTHSRFSRRVAWEAPPHHLPDGPRRPSYDEATDAGDGRRGGTEPPTASAASSSASAAAALVAPPGESSKQRRLGLIPVEICGGGGGSGAASGAAGHAATAAVGFQPHPRPTTGGTPPTLRCTLRPSEVAAQQAAAHQAAARRARGAALKAAQAAASEQAKGAASARGFESRHLGPPPLLPLPGSDEHSALLNSGTLPPRLPPKTPGPSRLSFRRESADRMRHVRQRANAAVHAWILSATAGGKGVPKGTAGQAADAAYAAMVAQQSKAAVAAQSARHTADADAAHAAMVAQQSKAAVAAKFAAKCARLSADLLSA